MTVTIFDDDRHSAYGLWALLRWEPEIRPVTASGADAATVVVRERPAVCLVSAALGVRFVHRLTQLPSRPRVLVYSDRPGGSPDGPSLIAGASETVWRYGSPEELTAAIRRAAAGTRQVPKPSREEIRRVLGRVEDRDRPIAAMMLLNVPPDDIARTVGISARELEVRRDALVRQLA